MLVGSLTCCRRLSLRLYFTCMALLMNKNVSWILAGLFFAMLWASASAATKFGLTAAQPLVLAEVRFGIASALLLLLAHGLKKSRLPAGREWRQIAIYGLLNITIYLGCYVIALQTVTAGIGTLAVATNPLFISFLSVFFLKHKLNRLVVGALVLGVAGVLCAAWPLLGGASVTTQGLVILFFSMLSYSAGAIYFAAQKWNGLHLYTINGWQTFFGGLFLLPFSLFFYKPEENHYQEVFWGAVLWLAVPVSIVAVQLWLWLLHTNAVKAGLWLFLCPLFGFAFAAWLLHDPLSWYTLVGVVLVITGLFIAQRTTRN